MSQIDQMWVLICALFVFFMQAGFICFEVGFVQPKNVISVAIENIIAFVTATISFFVFGYAIMFGPTIHGIIGSDYWIGMHLAGENNYIIIFFELMFAGTAVTIFSGSMSERTKTKALILSSILVGIIIYPIYGHWVWGSLYIDQNVFLDNLGFIDFAGATVVHSTAGWVAFAGILVVGPRRDRWDKSGLKKNLGRSNIPFAALGTFILWFSWFGFNGGSLLKFTDQVGLILLNTNIAACAGVIGAVGTVFFILKEQSYMEAIFGGALGGLVAITASSNLIMPIESFWIGLITGAVVVIGSALLEYYKIDDAVGAVSIHAFGGVSGTLLLALFASPTNFINGSRTSQFLIQSFGVLINFLWAFGMSYIMFKLIDRFMGLRVTPEEEEKGLNIVEYSDVYSWQQALKEASFENTKEQLYNQIKEQNRELEKHSQLLIATQEQERDKIGRDLHDGVGQLLAATKIDLGMLKKKLDNEEHKEQTSRVIRLIDHTVEEIRSVIFNLKPIQLERQGLIESIQQLTDQLSRISNITFNYNVSAPLPEWSETQTLNVFRIVQECLNNVVKHSEATHVAFVFEEKNGCFMITIIDNGKGFDYASAHIGIGTTSMKERTALLGGKLSVVSQETKGTKVILEIPYEKN